MERYFLHFSIEGCHFDCKEKSVSLKGEIIFHLNRFLTRSLFEMTISFYQPSPEPDKYERVLCRSNHQ